MLTCTKCKKDKEPSLKYFQANLKKRNGLDSWCRECRAVYKSNVRRGRYRSMIDDESLMVLTTSVKECAICGFNGDLVVDHDHKLNKVRGMLCSRCNRGIGVFKDDPYLLEFARIYLLHAENDPEAVEYMHKRGNKFICEEASND